MNLNSLGSGFTLASSKGACAVSSNEFTCASGNTATVFGVCTRFPVSCFGVRKANMLQASGGYLTYDGSTTFYASSVPSGSTQATVYTDEKSVSVKFKWEST